VSAAEAGRPVLALVESNTTGTGRSFATAARARGLRPVLLSPRPERYPWVAEDGVDIAWADTTDPTSIVTAARNAAGGASLSGLVSSSEYFAAVTARAAEALGLPGAEPAAVDRCRDKRRQRRALRAAGVAVPDFASARSPGEAVAAALAIGFPVVVKPADGTGSRGVRLCRDGAEVSDHVATLLQTPRDERGQPTIPAVLVEEYVSGPEVSVETFGTAVVGITAKHLGPLPSFVEYGHDFPADPAAPAGTEPAATAIAALRALGLGFGPAHTEIRLAERGPVVIEVNPRLAGGRIPTLVRLATGLDLVRATVDAAILGVTAAPLPEPGPGHASIRFLVLERAGRVRRTDGVAAAAAVPGVVDVAIAARPGQWLGGTGSFRDRVGHVITAASTALEARTAAEASVALLEIDVEMPETVAPEPAVPEPAVTVA
jgi:biotin carboxylase